MSAPGLVADQKQVSVRDWRGRLRSGDRKHRVSSRLTTRSTVKGLKSRQGETNTYKENRHGADPANGPWPSSSSSSLFYSSSSHSSASVSSAGVHCSKTDLTCGPFVLKLC